MQKLNKNGLFVKRVVGNDFSVGNAVVDGVRTSEDLAILNLTKEQMDILSYIVNSEGRNIPINEDGTFVTKIGHSYSVRYTDNLRLEEGYSTEEENFVIEKIGDGQLLFFAISEQCKINNPSYVVTEVFRLAALKDFVDWSGEGEPKWVKRLRVHLTDLLDGSEFVLEWLPLENKLVLHTDHLDDDMMTEVDDVLERKLPQNVEVARYNHSMDVDWRDYPLPRNYTAIAWIEGYFENAIHTDFCPSSNTEVHFDFVHLGKQPDNYGVLFGNSYMGRKDAFIAALYNGGDYAFDFGGYRTSGSNKSFNDKKRHYLKANRNELVVDGMIVGVPHEVAEFRSTNRMGIFTANTDEIKGGNYQIYEGKFLDEGVLHCHFLPALDETGAPCLYDIVGRKAYYNIGTGDFVFPTESTTYALRRELPDWGKLTEHGLRRLYHAPEGYMGELYEYALKNGFKTIVEIEMPEEGYWTPKWRETEDEIVLDWVEAEPSMVLES